MVWPGRARDDAPRIILVAERDPNVRDLQLHFLTRAGFTVEFVDSGTDALARVRESLPALLITEILLPRMDGLTLCRELREDPSTRDVPVIVFSILSAQARAIEAGARAYLRKPLVESSFLAAIDSVLAPQAPATLETK